jgi:hypothetical protein
MLYTTALMIHTGATLAALLSFMAGELLFAMARKGQWRPARMALRAGRSAHLLLNLGVLAGIVLVFLGGWPLWTPWLLAAFAVIAVAVAVRHGFVAPWELRSNRRSAARLRVRRSGRSPARSPPSLRAWA